MTRDADAARARAEASFKPRRSGPESAAETAERELRDRTARLREARLAKEAIERKGREIRAARRRSP